MRASPLALVLGAVLLGACGEAVTTAAGPRVRLADHSATPAFVKASSLPAGVRAYSLLSSEDRLPGSPNFQFGGSADGSGLLKNADGTFTILLNHEDNFAVSRIALDSTFKPVRGEYVLDSQNGRWRLCSATMSGPEQGFAKPVYFTTGESGIESQIHMVDPAGAPNTSTLVSAFGRWSAENAVPLTQGAFPGKTVVVIGDDDSGANGGQLVLYVADRPGDVASGRLYVMARKDDNTRERDMVVGQKYAVEFRQIENQQSLTGAQIEAVGLTKKMMQFGRVEDIDYRKGSAANNREVYFNVTGQNNTGANAGYQRTKYGRVYHLTLDAADPTRGTLEVVLDGDDRSGPAGRFQNPDNIFVGTNYAYIQEDPNSYGDETHDAYIYQYDLRTGALKVVMELEHGRGNPAFAKYNAVTGGLGSWEYGAMIDISRETGVADAFLLSIQPHTWLDDKFLRVAGPHPNAALNNTERQGSQLLVVTGLPR